MGGIGGRTANTIIAEMQGRGDVKDSMLLRGSAVQINNVEVPVSQNCANKVMSSQIL